MLQKSQLPFGQRVCYATTPLRPSTPLYAPSATTPNFLPTTKHLKYLSNYRVFSNTNPTQESPLLALSNAPSFVHFHEAVIKIAFTHNILLAIQDIATPKDSLEAC